MAPTATLKPLARAVLGAQSDARLVTLTREGSEDAFAEIVRRHRPGLLRFARSLGSGERSEDVVQDGLVRAWNALRKSDAEIDLRPWLTTIVRNRALSAHASVRYHEELDETIDGVRQPGDYALLHEELRSAVSAVNSLPEAQRQALVRSALDGESHERIAAELETTPGAVRQLIFRARTGLRDALGAVVPLPAVRGLVELTTHEAAAGGAAGSAGSVAAIAAGAGGGSIALKAVAVIAVGAAVAGSGVAIEHQRDQTADGGRSDAHRVPATAEAAAATTTTGGGQRAAPAAAASPTSQTSTSASGSATPTGGAPLATGSGAGGSTTRQATGTTTTTAGDGSQQPPDGQAAQQPPPTGDPTLSDTAPAPAPTDTHHHDGPGATQPAPGTQSPPPPPPGGQQQAGGYQSGGNGGYQPSGYPDRQAGGDYGTRPAGDTRPDEAAGSYADGAGAWGDGPDHH